jgi:hypothetical protein
MLVAHEVQTTAPTVPHSQAPDHSPVPAAGQGEWRFADGRSYFLGQYVDGQRVAGKLVLQPDAQQPAEEYQGE